MVMAVLKSYETSYKVHAEMSAASQRIDELQQIKINTNNLWLALTHDESVIVILIVVDDGDANEPVHHVLAEELKPYAAAFCLVPVLVAYDWQ